MDYENIFFNKREHRNIQSVKGWQVYYLLNVKDKIAVAEWPFMLKDNTAYSPFRATFGGPTFSDGLRHNYLSGFIRYILKNLKIENINRVCILTPPAIYTTGCENLNYILNKLNFKIEDTFLHSVIKIGNYHVKDRESKRRLKKTYREDYIFEKLDRHNEISELFSFIKEMRIKKQYPFSMSEEHFFKHYDALPKDVLCFRLSFGNTIAAGAICFKINDKVLLDFAHAHHNEMNSKSPSIRLISDICKYCESVGIDYFDLGSSEIDSIPNYSLISFKENMMGIPSVKYKLSKELQ